MKRRQMTKKIFSRANLPEKSAGQGTMQAGKGGAYHVRAGSKAVAEDGG